MKHDYETGPIIWRHAYDRKRDAIEGDLAATRCLDESLTVQSFTEDADINTLVRRFGITGIPLANVTDEVVDTTNAPDLRAILEARRAAANGFSGLPMKIRKRFHNSPEELWDFLNDPENVEEGIRLGLLTRRTSSTDPTSAATTKSATEPPGEKTPDTKDHETEPKP